MKKKLTATTQRGFTLIEMLVSLAIVALIAVVLSQVFIATLRTNTKTELLKDVKQNGAFAQELMTRMIQNAKRITSACSATGTTAQSITFTNNDNGQTTLTCSLDDTVTRVVSIIGESTAYLTSSNVTLGGSSCAGSSLSFTCFGATGLPSTITISFQLAQSNTAAQAFEQSSASFQTTATLRNVVE